MPTLNKIQHIENNTSQIIGAEELQTLLTNNKPIRIKAGFDPTAADLHLGHTILLNKLRQFQDLGHRVDFIIGDFTARIGDPTGRNNLRPPLSDAEILLNATSYIQQLDKVLLSEQTNIIYNSHWLDQLSASQLITLAAKTTVARILERDDFSKRYKNDQCINLHEFLYPLLQGYDSVHLNTDIEIGGTDQTFNLLMGRELQKHYNQKPQVIITLPILEGLDGINKMSKSLNNYIGLQDRPEDMFGKIMSINDTLMFRYYELLLDYSATQIEQLKLNIHAGTNPRDIKLNLATQIVTKFHTSSDAHKANASFCNFFQHKQIPKDIETLNIAIPTAGLSLTNLLKQANLVASTSEVIRLIKQGAITIDKTKISDTKLIIQPHTTQVYTLGKRRIAKITTSIAE